MDTQTPIEIVEPYQLSLLESEMLSKRGASAGNSERWERYHEALCRAAKKCGKKVGDDPEAKIDFYHGGDWFHELADSFAMRSPRSVSAKAFREMQAVVSAHDPKAVVTLGGELFTPIDGLEVVITSSGIYAAWTDHTPDGCRKALKEWGLDIESGVEKRWWEFWK
jgi:hypothetical protein